MNHNNPLARFRDIDTLIFDVDGVFTDGTMLVTDTGEMHRRVTARDGFVVRHAIQSGYRLAIITGGTSVGIRERFEKLGVPDVYTGVQDKLAVYRAYIDQHQLDPERILYMGDDLPDYEVMRLVGLPTCPSDAAEEVKAISLYISPFKGGHNCVRDVVEKVLKLNGDWPWQPFA